VRARLVPRAADWRWSGVHALLDRGRGDGLTATAPVLARMPDIASLIEAGEDEAITTALRRAETTGRPIGSEAFLDWIKSLFGRNPKPAKRGPKPETGTLS